MLREEWYGIEAHANRIFHRIYDCRRWSIHGQFADALGAMCAVNVAKFFKKYTDRRQVRGSRHDVIRHLVVDHASVLPDDFLVERKSDRLLHTAGNLPSSQDRVNHLADF